MASGYIVTPGSVIITHNGDTHVAERDNTNFPKIVEALKTKDFDTAVKFINLTSAINDFGKGKIMVKNGTVYHGDEPLNNQVTQHILYLVKDGFDADPMVNFLNNLMENPSKRAVDELYSFILAAKIAITPDGHLLAYKKVMRDSSGQLVDIYSKKFSNNVGDVVEVPRNKVDEDQNRTCSHGLHFCSQSYLPHYGGGANDMVVIVKINPRDVVAIPTDYNNAKGRCCRYEVVEIHPYTDRDEVFNKPVMTTTEIKSLGQTDYDEGYDIGYEDRKVRTSNYMASWGYSKKDGYARGYADAGEGVYRGKNEDMVFDDDDFYEDDEDSYGSRW